MSNNKIFVGGLSRETTDAGFTSFFTRFGQIQEAMVMRDRNAGVSRGFGFVVFVDPSSVDKVLAERDSLQLDGRNIDCKVAVPRTDTPPVHNGEAPQSTRKIFVGGLVPATTQEEFRAYFEQYGAVTEATIMYDSETGRSRGFGFVTFDSESTVEDIITKPHAINDKRVELKKAIPKQRMDRMNRGGDNYRGGGGGYGYGGPRGGYGGGYGGYDNHGPGGYGGYRDDNYGRGGGYGGGYGPHYGGGGYGGYGGPSGGYDGGYGGGRGGYGGGAPSYPPAPAGGRPPMAGGYDSGRAPPAASAGGYGAAPGGYGAYPPQSAGYGSESGASQGYGGYGQQAAGGAPPAATSGYDQNTAGGYSGYPSYQQPQGGSRGQQSRADRSYHPYQRA